MGKKRETERETRERERNEKKTLGSLTSFWDRGCAAPRWLVDDEADLPVSRFRRVCNRSLLKPSRPLVSPSLLAASFSPMAAAGLPSRRESSRHSVPLELLTSSPLFCCSMPMPLRPRGDLRRIENGAIVVVDMCDAFATISWREQLGAPEEASLCLFLSLSTAAGGGLARRQLAGHDKQTARQAPCGPC